VKAPAKPAQKKPAAQKQKTAPASGQIGRNTAQPKQ